MIRSLYEKWAVPLLLFCEACIVECAHITLIAQTGMDPITTHNYSPKFQRKLMQSLAIDWNDSGWSMAPCEETNDCASFGTRLICIDGKCGCDLKNFILLDDVFARGCFPKAELFSECITTGQCLAVNRNTYCNRNSRCTCSPGYFFDGQNCIIRYDTNLKAQEVYKAAVVAAACFIVAVVGIFVACIVRRSFCRRDLNTHQNISSNNDVFTVSDEIAALRAVDKPPSYEEVLQIERTFFGIPPPDYSSLRGGRNRNNQNSVPFTSNELHQAYFQQSSSSNTSNQVPECIRSDADHCCRMSTTAVISTLPNQSPVNIPSHDIILPAPREFNSPSRISPPEANHQSATLPRFPRALRPLSRNTSAPSSVPPFLHKLLSQDSSSASLPNSPHLVSHASQQSPHHSQSSNESLDVNHSAREDSEILSTDDTHESIIAYCNLGFVSDSSK